MKFTQLLILSFIGFFSCKQQSEQSISKTWQGLPVDFSQIREVVNTYHMYDSTGTKVGSMDFGFFFENGFLIARDTSQFDNGSVYETATFTFDTVDFRMKKVAIDMQTSNVGLDIDLRREDERVKGTYVLLRDTTSTTYEVDSAYQFSAFRGEIYMLTHTLSLKSGDTLSLEALVPTSMTVSGGKLIYSGVETIETINGPQACDVIWLKADGKMPDNKIWISQSSPSTIVKFYVPGPELDMVLVEQVEVKKN